jgi:D-alanine transaminase
MGSTIYLNGTFIPHEKACISPDDRGFYFADGVYEVIKYYKGRSFCFSDHLLRLKHSISETRIRFKAFDHLEDIGNELIHLNRMENEYAGIYLQITRGAAPRMHRFPGAETDPTVYMNVSPMPPFIHHLAFGIKVILREDIRWHRCDIKSVMLLPNVMMIQDAVENGARECFFVRNGFFTECAHSNIFGIKNSAVYTHPDSNLILPGITKKVILQVCAMLGIPFREEPIRADDFPGFDEFFISGTGNEVMPVIRIENSAVGDGRPGLITRQIQREFLRMTYGELAGDWSFREWISDSKINNQTEV